MSDRKQIYTEWEKISCEDGTAFFSPQSRNKFDKISDFNFNLYKEYQDQLFVNGVTAKVIANRRSKLLDFLLSLEQINCSLANISQSILDNYFDSKETDSVATLTSRVNFLKHFFQYCTNIITENIDVDRYRRKEENPETKNAMQALTPEQISLCRQRYKDDLRKLYVFEMTYYTDFTDEEIKNVKIEDVNRTERSIKTKGGVKNSVVPLHLIELIERMNEQGTFGHSFDIVACIKQMRKELKQFDIDNFKVKDGIETRRNTFLKCPQCGRKYELIADNWCVKQYTENGAFWIVCREKCGNG